MYSSFRATLTTIATPFLSHQPTLLHTSVPGKIVVENIRYRPAFVTKASRPRSGKWSVVKLGSSAGICSTEEESDFAHRIAAASREKWRREKMATTVKRAEKLVEEFMKGNDASHDASHVFRVRDMALSLAAEEGLSSSPDAMEIVELAALLHDIGDYKYASGPSEEKAIEQFLEEEGIEDSKKMKIVGIVKAMGFKEELAGVTDQGFSLEFGVVQDADRLDAIGAIGIARCFTFGGSRNRVLHDPNIKPRLSMSKEDYMNKEKQTTLNHFHEKLLKLKDLMKTQAGRRRAERRHAFMEEFMEQFYLDWDAKV